MNFILDLATNVAVSTKAVIEVSNGGPEQRGAGTRKNTSNFVKGIAN